MTGFPALNPTTGLPVMPPTAPTLAVDIVGFKILDQRVSRTDVVPVELDIYVGGFDLAISDGSFDITLYAEGLGPVADQSITPTSTPLVLAPSAATSGAFTRATIPATASSYPGCHLYTGTVSIPALTFPATGLGSYKLTASLTKTDPQPAGTYLPAHDIQAHTDGPVIRITA
jgi:hypothetical protein